MYKNNSGLVAKTKVSKYKKSVFSAPLASIKMRYMILLIALVLFGCQQSQESLLTKHKWEIEKISSSNLNFPFPENIDYGSPWIFANDSTVIMDEKYIIGGGLRDAIWNLEANNLTIILDSVNLNFQILELTESKLKLTLEISEESEIQYEFKSQKE